MKQKLLSLSSALVNNQSAIELVAFVVAVITL
jgi:hypothetical protein